MKKTVSFLLCVIMMISVIPISAFAEDPVYFWEFEGSVEGFGANNSTKEAVGGNLVQTITKSNTWLLSPNNLAINADSCPILKVRVKNSTNRVGHFAIEAIGTEKAAFTGNFINIGEIKNDGEFHEYEVDLSAMAPSEWRGTVTRFRLRLSQWTCEGTIEVDYIRIFQATSEGGETAPREGATVRFESNVPLSSLVVYQGAQYSGAVAKAESDGTYKLPAGLYTYTATSTDSYCKVHKNFVITEAEAADKTATKTIQIDLPQWQTPGYWQVKTIFLPNDEISETYFADPAPEIKLTTPYFAGNKEINDFTDQTELENFVSKADAACDHMWSTSIGTSDNNLNILLSIFSKGADNNGAWKSLEDAAESLRKLNKPIVWVGAQVHGNEVASGEAALQLITELCGAWGESVLDQVSVVVLPRQNPSGVRRNGRTPTGGNDINRDLVKLELVETQALNEAYWLFCPEVAIDAHEYGSVPTIYGGGNTYGAMDLLIASATNANVPASILDMGETLFKSAVHSKLASYGIRSMEYYDGSIASTMTQSGYHIKTNTNAHAMYPAFSFLLETLIPGGGYNSMIHGERRVKSHLIAAQTIIETAANNADEIKTLVENERQSLLKKASVYDEKDTVVLKQNYREVPIDISYIEMLTNELKTATVPFRSFSAGTVTKTVTRPLGYILPKTEAMKTAIERLQLLGAEITELPAGHLFEGVQKYVVKDSKVAGALDQGVYPNTVTADIVDCESLILETDAYLVHMDSKLTNFIAMALEPESESGYITYRIIDAADIAVGETLPYYRYIGFPQPIEEETETETETETDLNPSEPTIPTEPQKSSFPTLGVVIGAIAVTGLVLASVIIFKRKNK